ncbi:MAG: hypothetical protein HBSAPP03_26050 [Phycisphaerae bacterium]|nr:MAG: hypothetical protein HBSAPP03_26050 [Phycisphaerae bacterium]
MLACQTLPSLPAVAIKVLELTRDPQVSIARIAQTVQNDPALTTKVLRTINSSFYGLTTPCPNVSRAMTLLGLNTVKSIVLSFSLVDMSRTVGGGEPFDLTGYWRRAIYSAAAARALALATRACDPDDAFVGALIQDVGMLAGFAALRGDYTRVTSAVGLDHDALAALERSELGFDHARVGGMLAQRWKLPPELADCIAHHHHPEAAPPRSESIVRTVALGGYAAGALTHPEPKPKLGSFIVSARKWFGIDQAAAREIIEAGARGARELTKTMDVTTGDPPDVAAILLDANEQIAATQEALAEEQAALRRTNEELSKRATTDGLTGLFNRASYDRELHESMKRCKAAGQPISVIFLDADKFKSVNDQFGHQAGDAVLIETAKRLREVSEKIGTLCRYGGEEFVLVIPGASLDKARKVGELLRVAIERRPFDLAAYDIPGVVLQRTISVGVATCEPGAPSGQWTPEHLTHHADEAVYAAKQAGRNCVQWKDTQGILGAVETSAGIPTATPRRVLVVDDDPFSIRIIETAMRSRREFIVTAVMSREEALAALAAPATFDLVLMDRNLGSVSGIDVIREVRASRPSTEAVFVLMSGRTSPRVCAEATAAGAAAFIDKLDFSTNTAACLDRLLSLARPTAMAA